MGLIPGQGTKISCASWSKIKNKNIHACDDSYTTLQIFQKSLNCASKASELYGMKITAQQKKFF